MAENDNHGLELHPAGSQARAEHNRLVDRVSELFLKKDHLLHHDRTSALTDYYLLLGKDQLELFDRELQYRKLRYTCEMIQAAINASSRVDLELIQAKVELELLEWKQKIQELKESINLSATISGSTLTIEESLELKTIYRNLVKLLHPDINKGLTPEMEELWHSVQRAFNDADLESLRNISLIVSREYAGGNEPGAETEIRTAIDMLAERIKKLEAEIEFLKTQFPYNMLDKLQDQDWLDEEKNKIRLKIKSFDEQIEYYQSRLQTLKLICQDGNYSQN